jgi:two-component system chemotaxis response regulator CheB
MNGSISLVTIGCSAGGIEALKKLLPAIRMDTSIAFVVVLHTSPDSETKFTELFSSLCNVPVKEAEDKENIEPGRIYFAPAGYHLLIESNRSFSLSTEEPVQFSRPSIDVLFESAAVALKREVLAIILTGANSDGAAGIKEVLECGGTALVEDPLTARYPTMPQAAIQLNLNSSRLQVMNLDRLRHWLSESAGC